jgi:hypothetical protein
MSFPLTPANNQVTLENGIAYTYNASRGAWYRTPATALASLTSNTFTVLNSIIFSDGTSQTSAASPTDSYARTTANTATNNITILQGVNTTQNTRITNVENKANTNISSDLTLTVTNSGSGAYLIDGSPNPTLTLYRGVTYYFSINASGHPFYIQTVSGAYSSGNVYTSGVTGGGTQVGTLTFTVPLDAPNNLYYVCQNHSVMNGAFLISNLISTINTQNTRIAIIEGVDVGQNTRMSIIEGVDVGQNTRMSIIEGVNTTQNTNITVADSKAQAAFDKANAANNLAQAAYNAANNVVLYDQDLNTSNSVSFAELTITGNTNSQNIIPTSNNLYSLGLPNFRFKDIYVSSSIYLGNVTITETSYSNLNQNVYNNLSMYSFLSHFLRYVTFIESSMRHAWAGTIHSRGPPRGQCWWR